jgi:hypothetical protein
MTKLDGQFRMLIKRSMMIGGIAFVVCLIGALMNRHQFFYSYLVAYLFWFGISLGSLGFLMLHHLAGGEWGYVSRRFFESASKTLPMMALLFVPILFGLTDLYHWARPEEVSRDLILQQKSRYLNVPFFVGRCIVYFAAWIAMAYLLNLWSTLQDEHDDPDLGQKMKFLSGPGLVFYGLSTTFAAVDWIMSLQPHWYSTMYGAIFIVGQGLSALTFVLVLLVLFSDREPFSRILKAKHFHDLGNITLAFVLLWTYLSFSQFIIIWSGNLPEETPWYLERFRHGWNYVGTALVLFHFAIPFFFLLFRAMKRTAVRLGFLAAGILLMRIVDLFWHVAPTAHAQSVSIHLLDFVAPIAIGGIWVTAFLWQLRTRPLIPVHDHRVQGGLHG